MKRFEVSFVGRKVGALGLRYGMTEMVEAETADAALLKLYARFEHLSNVSIREVQ